MLLTLLLSAVLQAPAAALPQVSTEAPVEIAPGMHLIRVVPVQGRGPDGNTVIIEAPDGLIVVDTGRHSQITDAILAFAKQRQRPIVAIVNTHWHLDHASGNGRLKAVYPKARVYTTNAIDKVLAPGGFLARNLEGAKKQFGDVTDPLRRDEMEIFFATMAASQELKPDVPLITSGTMSLAGKSLDVRVTDKAVSDADVWIYDNATRVAVIGDLITMPVPYFETACPDRWRASLDEVWATPFQTAIPGHGRPMTRDQLDIYRKSLTEFVSCVRSDRPAAACGTVWVDSASTLIGDDPARRKAVAANMEYYVGYLRPNGGKAPDCLAQ
ncbi:MAG TPA: MBL fold metallo-hydrolase [Vicinamibacterales bacterium]|nr:MBL fold metallo-hydrolase [Vicinamibacterales bacterium]